MPQRQALLMGAVLILSLTRGRGIDSSCEQDDSDTFNTIAKCRSKATDFLHRGTSRDILDVLGDSRFEDDLAPTYSPCSSEDTRGIHRGDDQAWDVCLVAILTGEFECLPEPVELNHAVGVASCTHDEDKALLLQHIQEVQNPTDCSRAVPAPSVGFGFAASFHYTVIQLKRALQSNLTIGFPGFWLYSSLDPDCEGGSMHCSFRPATETCSQMEHLIPESYKEQINYFVSDIGWPDVAKHASRLPDAEVALRDGFFKCCNNYMHPTLDCKSWIPWSASQVHSECGENDPDSLPKDFASKGKFWLVSLLSGFLFSPLPHLIYDVRQALDRSGFDISEARGGNWKQTIGLQIRRGDACHVNEHENHNQNCVSTSSYADQVKSIGEKYGVRRIFLASNADNSLVDELRAMLPGYEIVAQAIKDRNKYACCEPGQTKCSAPQVACKHTDAMLREVWQASNGSGIPKEFLIEIVADIVALAQCDYLVGTFTSQISRLALELSYFYRGFVVPFVSLDIAWCWLGFNRGELPHRDGHEIDYGC